MSTRLRNQWQRVPIKDTYLGLYDGPHATPPPAPSGPVFLGIKNITDDGRLNFSDVRHISEDDFPKWTKRVEPLPGDIVFTYEATLNRYAIIPRGFRGCLGRRLALIRPDQNKVDTSFLFYYFFGADWRATINKNKLSGSTVDRVPLTSFPDFEINLPPLRTQQKIGSILSAYDDLIENNTRRIRILEEIAQSLYHEWFIHFRFPGHEKVKMVNSPVGKIPEGWEVKEIQEICCRINAGGTPSRKENTYWEDGSIDWYKTKELNDKFLFSSEEAISEIGLSKSSAKLFNRGAILMAIYAAPTVGRLGVLSKKACCNQAAIGFEIDTNLISNSFLFYTLFSLRNHFNSISQGAAQQNISKEKVVSTQVALPKREIVETFDEIIRPIWNLLENLQIKNHLLDNTRDFLLPELLEGEAAQVTIKK